VTEGGTLVYAGATVLLYRDSGDGLPGAGDLLAYTTTTDASGQYSFTGLTGGTYWVAIDSKTLSNPAYETGYGQSDVWAEQTYGVAGALRGGSFLATAGAAYGGRDALLSDDAAALASSEHIPRVMVTGTP
jgi:hypothetical protein